VPGTMSTSTTTDNALDVLTARGFVQDVTDADALRDLFATERVTFYYGCDPTATSLHIGHLVGIMAMAHLKQAGHRPIALAGGATGRIGDPSFRDAERELLDDDALERNLAGISAQLDRIIGLGDGDGLMVDNYDWIKDLSALEFLQDVGKHFSVNQMIARDSVKKRLTEREQGISYTEFSYQLLQAYDFAVLYEREGCRLQIGGSDQWGNIVAGVDLTRRLHGAEVHGLVWPLVTRSDGRKFSKSDGTAIWLDPEQTSAYAYYQWFVNVPDADVIGFLKLFTFLSLDEIAELERQHDADPAARIAHRTLARETTRIVHGDDGVTAAERATSVLFGDQEFTGLSDEVLADAFGEAPSVELPRGRLDEGLGLLELMTAAGASKSNAEARRLVDQGAVRLNNVVVDDAQRTVTADDLVGATTMVLKVGKKRYFLARFA
jgi:tyrosyl-tRNA synthetase